MRFLPRVVELWNTRLARWRTDNASAGKMAAELQFCALSGFLFWLLVLLPLDALMSHLPVFGIWIFSPWRLTMDCALGATLWGMHVASKCDLRRYDNESLLHATGVCAVFSCVGAYLLAAFLRGRMPADIPVALLLSVFFMWSFIVWAAWTGAWGRYIKCVFGESVWATIDLDFGWGMPLGDRESKREGDGFLGNLLDWTVRLVVLAILAFMFAAMYAGYILLLAPDDADSFFTLIDAIVKVVIWFDG